MNSALPATSRKEAAARGLETYFTGKPCKSGHTTERKTKGATCIGCLTDKSKRAIKRTQEAKYRAKNLQTIREKSKAYRLAFPEKAKLAAHKSRIKRAEKVSERGKATYRANPKAAAARWRKRRAIKAEATGSHTVEDISAINKNQRFACVYCGISTAEKYEVDHIIPLSRGGSDYPENLQILCMRCNRSKHTKTHDEYVQYLELVVSAANDNFKEAA